ncbi:MAG: ABC transporter permease [Candidatus Hodarchaeales archaeon]
MVLPDQTLILEVANRLLVSAVLLMAIILLSYWQKIRMEKMFLLSFFRGLIQILLMALVLIVIFSLTDIAILFIALLFMCTFAAYTSKRRFPYKHIFRIEMLAITSGSISIMVIAVMFGIIPVKGEYIIPMGGMVIANAMVMTTIVLERMISDVQKNRGLIEAALSLGDSSWNSVKNITRDSYRAAFMPTTNRVAVLGIVTIPGLMSGMIIGGTNPLIAAVYQIIIFLMILSAGFIGSIVLAYFFVRELFNDDDQLQLSLITQFKKTN